MNSTAKDVIYIDVDDEITAIIDKVLLSEARVVALVLPKRATVLQSIVNMKLLKRSADEADKHLVLVTTEKGLLPLAGAVGVYVAKTPQSKPEIPHAPNQQNTEVTDNVSAKELTNFEPEQHDELPAVVPAIPVVDDEEEAIDLDNSNPTSKDSVKSNKAAHTKGKNKKLKVPNFGSFRNRLLLGGGVLLVLIGLIIYALVALPNAVIAISTNTDEVSNTLDVTFDATASEVNIEEVILPSVVERVDRTDSETVPATGERNDGDRAKAKITITAQVCGTIAFPATVPEGTRVTASENGYILQEDASFSFDGFEGGSCMNFIADNVEIEAAEGGSKYNVKDATFTVAGRSELSAVGSADGGKDKIVTVVAEADIRAATEKLERQGNETIIAELTRRLQDRGVLVVEESLSVINPQISASPEVGDEAESVTVTRRASYALVGAKEADLNTLITGIVAESLENESQVVLSTGVRSAEYQLQNQRNNAAQVLISMNVVSVTGPELQEDSLKEQVAGMKSAEAEALIGAIPGVSDVQIEYGPFWVSSIPKNVNKITITFEN